MSASAQVEMEPPAPAADLSQEQLLAALPYTQQQQILAGLSEDELEDLVWDWSYAGRPSQQICVDERDWAVRLLMGGRGSGKSRAGAEWVRELDTQWPRLGRDPLGGALRIAFLGRTAADVRDTMINGPSGLVNIGPPSWRDRVNHIPTRRTVELPGGAEVLTYSAEEPDQLRGPAFHAAWADERATYRDKPGIDGLTAWDNLRIAVRMGLSPQIVATTTPKRTVGMRKLVREAATSSRVLITRMRTLDNAYLAETYLDVLLGLFGGTSIGRQELDGEMLDDVEGALLAQTVLDAHRVPRLPPDGPWGPGWLRVVAVDPSVAERPQDECGIVVCASPGGLPVIARTAYIVDDRSGRMGPAAWGRTVVEAARHWHADVIAETNQGGALVRRVIAEEAARLGVPAPKVREVHAKVGKAIRAEPVIAAFERGRVNLVGTFPELEDQFSGWVPGESGYSPDRLDAAVYALMSLLIPSMVKGGLGGASTIHSAANLSMDGPPSAATKGQATVLVPVGLGRRNGWGIGPKASDFTPGRARRPRLPSQTQI